MGRVAKLVCVEIDKKGTGNSNKFYNITENADGTLSVLRGRVGSTEIVEKPNSSWTFDKLVASKLKKGYQNITSLKQVEDQSSGVVDVFNNVDAHVSSLLKFLMDCSNKTVSTNYLVATDDVTKAQIEKAQELINDSIQYIQTGGNVALLNKTLMQLYTILPRKMKNVKDYLATQLTSDKDIENVRKLIDGEQSLLSTLESQVLTNQQTASTTGDNKNILQEMGIEMSLVTDKTELDKIHTLLQENKNQARRIFKVTNHSTQKRFNAHVEKAKEKEVKLLFHGSRNENFLGILQKGLLIRPAGAIIAGSMFGWGIYTASKSQKSLGYSSLSGSYWTKGNANKGFLALFSVHTGKQKDIHRHDSSCYNLHDEAKKGNWDSVFAHAGNDLRNDEIIVYNIDQTTISYLIEMEN